jgi:hypothetical protein
MCINNLGSFVEKIYIVPFAEVWILYKLQIFIIQYSFLKLIIIHFIFLIRYDSSISLSSSTCNKWLYCGRSFSTIGWLSIYFMNSRHSKRIIWWSTFVPFAYLVRCSMCSREVPFHSLCLRILRGLLILIMTILLLSINREITNG